jgi:hypothetical protein
MFNQGQEQDLINSCWNLEALDSQGPYHKHTISRLYTGMYAVVNSQPLYAVYQWRRHQKKRCLTALQVQAILRLLVRDLLWSLDQCLDSVKPFNTAIDQLEGQSIN